MRSSLLIRSQPECDGVHRGRPYRKRHAKSSRCSSRYQDWRRRATRHHDSVIQRVRGARVCVCVVTPACSGTGRAKPPGDALDLRAFVRFGDVEAGEKTWGERAERVCTVVGTRCCCRLVVGYRYLLRWSVYSGVCTSREWCRGEDSYSAYSGRRLTLVFKSIRVPPLKLSSCAAIRHLYLSIYLYLPLSTSISLHLHASYHR